MLTADLIARDDPSTINGVDNEHVRSRFDTQTDPRDAVARQGCRERSTTPLVHDHASTRITDRLAKVVDVLTGRCTVHPLFLHDDTLHQVVMKGLRAISEQPSLVCESPMLHRHRYHAVIERGDCHALDDPRDLVRRRGTTRINQLTDQLVDRMPARCAGMFIGHAAAQICASGRAWSRSADCGAALAADEIGKHLFKRFVLGHDLVQSDAGRAGDTRNGAGAAA